MGKSSIAGTGRLVIIKGMISGSKYRGIFEESLIIFPDMGIFFYFVDL